MLTFIAKLASEMRRIAAFALAVGCAGGVSHAAERPATIVVAPDSVVFEIPMHSSEDEWKVSFPVFERMGWEHDGVVTLSMHEWRSTNANDPTDVRLHDEATLAWGDDACKWLSSVTPTFSDGVLRCNFGRMEGIIRLRPLDARVRVMHADGSGYKEFVQVVYLPDPRAQLARSLAGPLSVDECAIYQRVLDSALPHDDGWGDEIVLPPPAPGQAPDQVPTPRVQHYLVITPTTDRGPLPGEADRLAPLGVDEDCIADFLQNRSIAVDLSSLKPLGYDMMERTALEEVIRARDARRQRVAFHVEVSLVGFNAARDQAIVLVAKSYGGSSDSDVIHLDKVDGEWLVTRRLNLYFGG